MLRLAEDGRKMMSPNLAASSITAALALNPRITSLVTTPASGLGNQVRRMLCRKLDCWCVTTPRTAKSARVSGAAQKD